MKLYVKTNSATDVMSNFPRRDDQYIEDEYNTTNSAWVTVNLGDANDTTTAQEQYLDAHPDVIYYRVS